MPRKKLSDEKKLFEDIKYLSEENWKKVRRYVTKLRQVQRMDADAFHVLVNSGLATFADRDKTPKGIECSFCGKYQNQVARLVAGPGVYICNECIALCDEILEETDHADK